MPSYEYRCSTCGLFELERDRWKVKRTASCASCGSKSPRHFNVQIKRPGAATPADVLAERPARSGPRGVLSGGGFYNCETPIKIVGGGEILSDGQTFKGNKRIADNEGGTLHLRNPDISAS